MLGGLGDRSVNPDVTVASYLFAARDLPLDAIAIAADRFQRGLVPGHKKGFAPNTAEFCSEVRKTPSDQFAKLGAPTNPLEPEISPEERERVGRKMDELAGALRADSDARRRGEEAERSRLDAGRDAQISPYRVKRPEPELKPSPALEKQLREGRR